MTFHEQNKHRLKAFLEGIGAEYNHDFPYTPDKYEGSEHLVVWAYANSSDWDGFINLLKSHTNDIIREIIKRA